jgi:hypothetical protein
MKMRNLALIGLLIVVIGGCSMGCIDQTGPVIPSVNEMEGYSMGWEDGRQMGFITGYVAYLRANNLTEDHIDYNIETTPQEERAPGYDLGEQQGYKAAWGYGYDASMSVYKSEKWYELGYILLPNETTEDFYKNMGYDLTNVLKKGSDQTKGITDDAKEAVSIAEVKSTGNKAQLIDSIAKEAKRLNDPELVEVVEVEVRGLEITENGSRFINSLHVREGVIGEDGGSYTWTPDRLREA